MFDSIVRKDIEYHVYHHNSKGMPTGTIIAKPVTIFYDKNEISDDEVRLIVDSHRYDISNCRCNDDRMHVMTTPMADRLVSSARQQGISMSVALSAIRKDSLMAG
jgi:hypothetical protein